MKLSELGNARGGHNRRTGTNEPVGERQQIRGKLVKALREQCGAERIAIFIFGGGGIFLFRDRWFALQTRQGVGEGITGTVGGLETCERADDAKRRTSVGGNGTG